jgi:hypothetical protein
MLKTITHPVTGKTFKMGRRRPVAHGPRLSLKNYLMASIPNPPASVDYTQKAKATLANIYENDVLGDCVIAGMAHIEGVLTGNVGASLGFTSAEITALYSAIGGYVPGDESTDNGCDEQTALNWWQSRGMFPGGVSGAQHKITGYLAVNAASSSEVRQALWLFENLMFGVELPDAWVNPMPEKTGFVWNVAGAPDPDNGHCFIGAGYSENGIIIDTWGMLGTVFNAAVEKYAASANGGELYAVLSQDAISKATAKAPNGFDFSQLLADLESMKP